MISNQDAAFNNTSNTEKESQKTSWHEQEFEDSVYCEHHFICPITQELMRDPVKAEDKYTYEHEAITNWIKNQIHKNGVAKSPLAPDITITIAGLMPNVALKNLIETRESFFNEQKIEKKALIKKNEELSKQIEALLAGKKQSAEQIKQLSTEKEALSKQVEVLLAEKKQAAEQAKQLVTEKEALSKQVKMLLAESAAKKEALNSPKSKSDINIESKQTSPVTLPISKIITLSGFCNIDMINMDDFTFDLTKGKKVAFSKSNEMNENQLEKNDSVFLQIEVNNSDVHFNYNYQSKQETYFLKAEIHTNPKIIELKSAYHDVTLAHCMIIEAELINLSFYQESVKSIMKEPIIELRFAKLLDLIEAPLNLKKSQFFTTSYEPNIDKLKTRYLNNKEFKVFQLWLHRNDNDKNLENKYPLLKEKEALHPIPLPKPETMKIFGDCNLRNIKDDLTLDFDFLKNKPLYISKEAHEKANLQSKIFNIGYDPIRISFQIEAVKDQITITSQSCYLNEKSFTNYKIITMSFLYPDKIVDICDSISRKLNFISGFPNNSLASIMQEKKIDARLLKLVDFLENFISAKKPDFFSTSNEKILEVMRIEFPKNNLKDFSNYKKWYQNNNDEEKHAEYKYPSNQ